MLLEVSTACINCTWLPNGILVGAKLSPENSSELKFLYEGHQEFSAIPSFAVIPAFVSYAICTLMIIVLIYPFIVGSHEWCI